jgi:multidrug efflux system membrane fusion protein
MMKMIDDITKQLIVTTSLVRRRRSTGSKLHSPVWLVAAASVLSLAWVATSSAQDARRGNRPGNNVTVAAATVMTADVPVYVSAVGTVTARYTATVRARVSGQLDRVQFKEGQMVKAGEVLAVIDRRPYQVVLDQTQAQLQRDQAQYENAQHDLERYQNLVKDNTISQQQVDTQAALVRQYAGTVAMDRALGESAKLNVGYTNITAPIAGRLGLRQVDPGNLVSTTDANGIVVITQIKPIDVIFAIPEDRLSMVLKQLNTGTPLPVDALDRDGKSKLASGTLLTVDNQIDTTTGTVKLKGTFVNEDGSLFPNQFVNVRLQVSVSKGATVVPSAAVQQGSAGTYVYVVKPDNTVAMRTITTGPSNGDKITVSKGLTAGERVVTDGLDKLREGAKVMVSSPNAMPAPGPGQAQPGQRSTHPGDPGNGKRQRSSQAAQ